jgi:hypothetical protein
VPFKSFKIRIELAIVEATPHICKTQNILILRNLEENDVF